MQTTNIIVENGFDFWKELNHDDNKPICKEVCELTGERLTRNYITMPCGHKFNYKDICIEIASLKNPKNYKSMTRLLTHNQMCCPYCRQIFNKLLPDIPCENVGNMPKYVVSNNCIDHHVCKYTYKSGKNKGCTCDDPRGFETEEGEFLCKKHWRARKTQKMRASRKAKPITFDMLNIDEKEVYTNNTVVQLREMLRNKHLKLSGTKAVLVKRLVTHG